MPGLLLAGWLTAFGADAFSTHAALNRGAHELVLTQNPWTNDALIGAQAVGGALILNHLWRRGHKKTVVVVTLAGIGLRSAAAIHNFGL